MLNISYCLLHVKTFYVQFVSRKMLKTGLVMVINGFLSCEHLMFEF